MKNKKEANQEELQILRYMIKAGKVHTGVCVCVYNTCVAPSPHVGQLLDGKHQLLRLSVVCQ